MTQNNKVQWSYIIENDPSTQGKLEQTNIYSTSDENQEEERSLEK